MTEVDRDRDLEVRLCTPGAKSKSFVILERNSQSFKLDPAGNAKAAELVKNTGKKTFLEVTVAGEIYKGTIHVVSIAAAK